MASLLARYATKIKGVLSCYDRVVIQGTLLGLCHAKGMTAYLHARGIRIFDYAQWAEPLRDALRSYAETLAAGARAHDRVRPFGQEFSLARQH